MKICGIIQARMGSTRLPGKVMKDICGETVLARVIRRLRYAKLLDELVVATTDKPADDEIVAECQRYAVMVWRGDEQDVLDRYFRAAESSQADIVVRITSDCPLIDPEITDRTIAAFLGTRPDYASNALVRTYPRGLDTEVISREALARAWRLAQRPYEREHVTPYIYEHPSEFKILSVQGDADFSNHRWTLDTPEDLNFVRTVYSRFEPNGLFTWRQLIERLEIEPEISDLNRAVVQKALH